MLLKGSAALIMGSAQGLGLVCAKASYIADETIYIYGGSLNSNLYFFCEVVASTAPPILTVA